MPSTSQGLSVRTDLQLYNFSLIEKKARFFFHFEFVLDHFFNQLGADYWVRSRTCVICVQGCAGALHMPTLSSLEQAIMSKVWLISKKKEN